MALKIFMNGAVSNGSTICASKASMKKRRCTGSKETVETVDIEILLKIFMEQDYISIAKAFRFI